MIAILAGVFLLTSAGSNVYRYENKEIPPAYGGRM